MIHEGDPRKALWETLTPCSLHTATTKAQPKLLQKYTRTEDKKVLWLCLHEKNPPNPHKLSLLIRMQKITENFFLLPHPEIPEAANEGQQ